MPLLFHVPHRVQDVGQHVHLRLLCDGDQVGKVGVPKIPQVIVGKGLAIHEVEVDISLAVVLGAQNHVVVTFGNQLAGGLRVVGGLTDLYAPQDVQLPGEGLLGLQKKGLLFFQVGSFRSAQQHHVQFVMVGQRQLGKAFLDSPFAMPKQGCFGIKGYFVVCVIIKQFHKQLITVLIVWRGYILLSEEPHPPLREITKRTDVNPSVSYWSPFPKRGKVSSLRERAKAFNPA